MHVVAGILVFVSFWACLSCAVDWGAYHDSNHYYYDNKHTGWWAIAWLLIFIACCKYLGLD